MRITSINECASRRGDAARGAADVVVFFFPARLCGKAYLGGTAAALTTAAALEAAAALTG
jgi:hypothetical protein